MAVITNFEHNKRRNKKKRKRKKVLPVRKVFFDILPKIEKCAGRLIGIMYTILLAENNS